MTTSTHTGSEKRYNEIALTWLAGTEPDSTATADWRSIAQTCLSDGGRAVLGARGQCEVWLKEHYGEDSCQGVPQGRSAKPETKAVTSSGLVVIPNPASDFVRVQLKESQVAKVPLRVQVLTLSGQEVFTGVLSPDSGELSIPVRDWPNGIYFVRVSGSAGPLSRAFVIQHN